MLRQAASLLSGVLRSSATSSCAAACASSEPAQRTLQLLRPFLQDAATSERSSMCASSTTTLHTTRAYHPSTHSTSDASAAGSKEPAAGSGETISVTFIDKEEKAHTVQAPLGKHLLEVAHDNEIDLEGACEGSLACSTCHVIVENEEYFKRIPEATEDELDMLDLAFGLTDTSRLGCQVIASKDIDGIVVRIPAASRNFYVDGHKPKPH